MKIRVLLVLVVLFLVVLQPSEMMDIVVMLGLVALYFFPAVAAQKREHKNSTSICLLNIFLGWTFVGWVIALVWAFSHQEPKE